MVFDGFQGLPLALHSGFDPGQGYQGSNPSHKYMWYQVWNTDQLCARQALLLVLTLWSPFKICSFLF